jgi:hypothetical protein
MYSYLVSLDINTQTMALADLSRLLGVEPSVPSFDKGSCRTFGKKKGTPHAITHWTLESTAAESAPLVDHFRSIFERLPAAALQRSALPPDSKLVLRIGVMFRLEDIVYPEVCISSDCLDMLDGGGISIEISIYPGHKQIPPEEER